MACIRAIWNWMNRAMQEADRGVGSCRTCGLSVTALYDIGGANPSSCGYRHEPPQCRVRHQPGADGHGRCVGPTHRLGEPGQGQHPAHESGLRTRRPPSPSGYDLPRLEAANGPAEATTSLRRRALGASTPLYMMPCLRGRGTSSARRARSSMGDSTSVGLPSGAGFFRRYTIVFSSICSSLSRANGGRAQ